VERLCFDEVPPACPRGRSGGLLLRALDVGCSTAAAPATTTTHHSARSAAPATTAHPPPAQPPTKPTNAFETVTPAQQDQQQPTAPKPEAPAAAPVLPQSLNGQVIAGVEFRGARRVPQDTLRAQIYTKRGDLFNEDILRRDFMLLWNTGRFDDIRLETEADPEGLLIRFVVTAPCDPFHPLRGQ